jgi:hypothetical protein
MCIRLKGPKTSGRVFIKFCVNLLQFLATKLSCFLYMNMASVRISWTNKSLDLSFPNCRAPKMLCGNSVSIITLTIFEFTCVGKYG